MNRRDFIKTSAGAFAFASANQLFGAAAPSNKVRLAIVGCHQYGRGINVMRGALKVPGVEIACVCDVDSRAMDFAAAEVEKLSGIKPIKEKDLRKVLELKNIDGIISETPDHWHAYSAVLAMRAGKAVYVEKPCCFCPEEGQILMRVAKETNGILQVGSQRHSSLSYQAALKWLKETNAIGEMKWGKCWYMANRASIGHGKPANVPEWLDWELWQGPAPRTGFRDNIVHYKWHWFKNWGTAEMGNNGPHYADASRWFLGEEEFPAEVQCMGGQYFPKDDDYEFPDTFNASFKYRSGKFITFELTSHCNEKPYGDTGTGAMVYGTKGCVMLKPDNTVLVFDENSKLIKQWTADGAASSSSTPVSTTNPTSNLDVLHVGNFVDCIRARRTDTCVPAEYGVKSSYLPIVANLALDCGETIKLDPVTGKLLTKAGEKGWAREYAKGWELV